MMVESVKLIMTVGLPGCGKSTYAREWVAQNVRHRARVERDQLRAMMHDSVWKGDATERQIVAVQKLAVEELLTSGVSVVVSDTNLTKENQDLWRDIAKRCKVQLVVKDFRNVPLEQVLAQNAQRTGKQFIPVEVITNLYNRYIKEQS